MAVSALSQLSLTTLFDEAGVIIRPATLYVSRPDTETPIIVYQDSLLSVPHPNPILTTGTGRVPQIWVGVDSYRIRIFDQFGQLQEDLNNLPGAVVPEDDSGGGPGPGPVIPTSQLVTTGRIMFVYGSDPIEGYVRGNGLTIGSTVSGATERANNDTEALYKWLWARDVNLAVIGGRGASADGDWTAGKQLALPSLKGRSLTCVEGFGAANGGALNGGLFGLGSPTVIGSAGGSASHVLSWNEMPSHNHAATPSFSMDAAGYHQHDGVTSTTGNHNHGYNSGNSQSNYGGGPQVSGSPPVSKTTSTDGNHFHTFLTNPAGLHAHTISGSVTIHAAGGSGAHNNLPPFFLVGMYLKL